MPFNFYSGGSSPRCPQCGASNPFINAFCLSCGEKLPKRGAQTGFDPLYDDPIRKPKAKAQTAAGYWTGVLGANSPRARSAANALRSTQQLPDPDPVRPAPRKKPAHYCPHCVNCHPHAHHHFEYDEPNTALRAVSFAVPPVGLYLSTVNKKSHPLLAAKTARSAVFGMMFFCAVAAARAPLGNAVQSLQERSTPWLSSVINRMPGPKFAPATTANLDKTAAQHHAPSGRSATPHMRRHHRDTE